MKEPLSVSEVMLRGERLARLRSAGIRDPHRFIRSNREMLRALRIHAQQTGRPLIDLLPAGFTPSDECAWCRQKVAPGEVACPEHYEAEEDLRRDLDWR